MGNRGRFTKLNAMSDDRGQEFLFDGQSPRQQGLCLGMLAVHAMENPQVIERGDDTGMKFAMHGLVNLQHLELHRLRLHILPFAGIDLRQSREVYRHTSVVQAELLCFVHRHEKNPLRFCVIHLLHGLLPCLCRRLPRLSLAIKP
jgi:hypothetical protein